MASDAGAWQAWTPLGSGVERGLTHQLERLFANGTEPGLSEEQLLDRFAIEQGRVGVRGSGGAPWTRWSWAFAASFCVIPMMSTMRFRPHSWCWFERLASLRQKDLLGNWLYGVACRVALRSRTVGIRRQTQSPCPSGWKVCRCAGGSRFSEPVSEAVLSDEERPLVHEEVNRLPRKYRTPIVLCYFEGLTHDQAAARLGWPVGTVKGRLSRARDLLRTRLSRRGVCGLIDGPCGPSGRSRAEGVGSCIADARDTQCRTGGRCPRRCRDHRLVGRLASCRLAYRRSLANHDPVSNQIDCDSLSWSLLVF